MVPLHCYSCGNKGQQTARVGEGFAAAAVGDDAEACEAVTDIPASGLRSSAWSGAASRTGCTS